MKLHYSLFALLVMVSVGCKKEYVDKYYLLPGDTTYVNGYTNIIAFQVNEFSKDTTLQAVITHDSIVLYWPWYRDLPDSIRPAITLPAKAVVEPLSGRVIAAKDGQAYTVTSEAGSKMIYKFYIDRRQPKPVVAGAGNEFMWIGANNTLTARWLLPDTSKTKVTLTALDGQHTYAVVMLNASTTQANFAIRSDVPPGKYDVNLVCGAYSIASAIKNIEVVAEPFPYVFDFGMQVKTKPGAKVMLQGTYLSLITGAYLVVSWDTAEAIPIAYRVVSDDVVEVTLPADVAPGTYAGISLTSTPDGIYGPSAGTTLPVIIAP